MTPGAYKHLQSPDEDPGSLQTAHLGGPTQTSVINVFTRLHVSQGTTRLNCETCQKMYMPPHPHPSFCFRKSGMNLGIHIQLTSKQGRASGHRPLTLDSQKSKCNFTVSPPCKRFHTCRVNTADRAVLRYALTEKSLSVSKRFGTVRTCVVQGSIVFQELHG